MGIPNDVPAAKAQPTEAGRVEIEANGVRVHSRQLIVQRVIARTVGLVHTPNAPDMEDSAFRPLQNESDSFIDAGRDSSRFGTRGLSLHDSAALAMASR